MVFIHLMQLAIKTAKIYQGRMMCSAKINPLFSLKTHVSSLPYRFDNACFQGGYGYQNIVKHKEHTSTHISMIFIVFLCCLDITRFRYNEEKALVPTTSLYRE